MDTILVFIVAVLSTWWHEFRFWIFPYEICDIGVCSPIVFLITVNKQYFTTFNTRLLFIN